MRHTSLTPDEELNSLVHGTLLYVNIIQELHFEKQSSFWPTLYMASRGFSAAAELGHFVSCETTFDVLCSDKVVVLLSSFQILMHLCVCFN